MGNSHYREQYYRKEWTKRIDIAFLYQLQMLYEAIKRRTTKSEDREIEEWASTIRRILATVNEEVENIKLDDKQLPGCDLQDLVNVATDQPALKILTRHRTNSPTLTK